MVCLAMILSANTARALTEYDLSPKQKDFLAEQLKDNEVCQMDLFECQESFKKEGGIDVSSQTFIYGAIAGATTVFILNLIFSGGNK